MSRITLIILIIAALCLVATGGLGASIYLKGEENSERQAEIRSLEAEITTFQQKVDQIPERKAILEDLKVTNDEIWKVLPFHLGKTKMEKQVTARVMRFAEDAGLDYTGGGMQVTTQRADPLTKIVLNMPIVGTYSQFMHFLAAIEHHGNIIVVDNLTLTPSSEGGPGQETKVSVTLGITAYYYAYFQEGAN